MLQSAEEHAQSQAALAALAVQAVDRMVVDPRAIHDSWVAGIAPVVRAAVAAQVLGAQSGEQYVAAALSEQGVDVDPDGVLNPRALVGVAGDGRPVASLADVPRWTALDAVAAGVAPLVAVREARESLGTMMATVVQDAGRAAESVAIAVRPRVGWVRMASGNSCSRCIVLLGRLYRFNDGFDRHPRDDCTHIPSVEDVAGDVMTDPRRYFDNLSLSEQDRRFTKAGAQAIRDGADMGQVVNARRGMTTATNGRLIRNRDGLFTTTEGSRRRSGRPARLMPESVMEIAEDRADAVRLLKANGYIT